MAVRPRAPTAPPENTVPPAHPVPPARHEPGGAPPPGSSHSATGPPEHCELYSPGAMFSWPELPAMAADGLLTQLYQRGYLPPGVPARPQLRARAASLAVAPAIRQRVVAGRMTAAWIYGCA